MKDDDPQHPNNNRQWNFRSNSEYVKPFVPETVYDGFENFFSIKLLYGGVFTPSPGRKYAFGKAAYVDYCNIEEFSVHEIDWMVRDLQLYVPDVKFYYHFKIPELDLDVGLCPLGNDGDVRLLAKYVAKNKLIKVFIEHGETKVKNYFSPTQSSKVVIQELENEGGAVNTIQRPRRKKLRVSKNLLLQWKDVTDVEGSEAADKVINDVTDVEEGNTGGVETVNAEGNTGGVEAVDKLSNEVVNEGVTNEDVEANVGGVEANVGGVEANVGGVEVNVGGVEVNVGGVEVNVGGVEANVGVENASFHNSFSYDGAEADDESTEGDDSDDSDFVEGLESMDEAEYDMMDYHANVDRGVEFMGAEVESVGNHDVDTSDDLLDDENLSYESFDSLTDEEMEDFETRRSLKLRELRRKKRVAQSTSQVTFYVGQLFPTAKAAKDKINKHAIETRRSLSFLRNDKRRIRVVCEGRCPIFTCGPNQTGPSQSGPGIHIQSASGPGIQKGKESSANGTKKGFKKGLVECNDKRKGRLNSVDCPWVLYLSRLSDEDETWVVKTYQPDHKCLTSRKIQPFTSTFLAKQEFVMNQIAANPNISVSRLQEELGRKYELSVTKMKAFRTKLKATKKIEGDFKVQYASLRDYVMELHRTNPGTTVKFVVEPECNPHAPTRIFKRIYICLGPLKEGFKECRRELLGLDGAFMKGPYPGQMLTAVGLDPNNGIYPLAYGIVEAENKDSWIWFLQCIKDDLDLPDNANFTFISDRQKGIIPAISQVFPAAEHRFCARHIWQNMKLQWRGDAFKDCLQNASKAYTVPDFEAKMEELRLYNIEAYNWLASIPPIHWSRSHFTGRAQSDVVLNNMCEVLNARTVNGRDKPIISALEFVREYLMQRIVNVIRKIRQTNGPLTPRVAKIFENTKKLAANYNVRWSGGTKYQVSGKVTVDGAATHKQYVVDVVDRVCTCREWEVSGIPCRHAVAVNWDMAMNGQEVGPPESWVNECYYLETWKRVYSHTIGPINGRELWPKSQVPTNLTPPLHHTPIGRPKKKRRKDAVELQDEVERASQARNKRNRAAEADNEQAVVGGKFTRKWKSVKCQKCGEKGHNQRTCGRTKTVVGPKKGKKGKKKKDGNQPTEAGEGAPTV
ncbi:uncharacterized protein LOC110880602 [Helianthus annuus]|uniref:uncharacterized protein LOC110880602 n=2 Tax=Helianthus annuus TaxID=4232 RepID=UPI0016532DB0|nr:uncharacterized protein LOC110880602 [Helianthus annuus]